jgi:hypothetical protein
MKLRFIIPIIVSLLFLSITRIITNASTEVVLKSKLPYEIHHMSTSDDALTMNGWAFINSNQHFIDESTHTISIEFSSINNRFEVEATLINHNMTTLMFYRGSRMCESQEYFQVSSSCNYYYKNVGFELTVDFSRFLPNDTYHAMVVVYAKQTNQTFKTQLFFPMKEQIIQSYGDYAFTINSNIKDTKLVVSHSNVVVRNGPGQTHAVVHAGASCSLAYGNQLFYRKDRSFVNLLDKRVVDLVSYYKIMGQIEGCFQHRQRVKEGQDINPMWIASPFIEYGGIMLTVNNRLINEAPNLTLEHPIIQKYESFNPLDYASAFDKEEGDLTSSIKTISNKVNVSAVGIYEVTLRVEDQYGYFDEQVMFVTVIDNNHPPIIIASNQVIRQFSVFNPRVNVYAHDKEDGDLTHAIVLLNKINSSQLGDQNQCYSVKDSQLAAASKCVVISVVEGFITTQPRFASLHIGTTKDELWKSYQHIFNREMTNRITILENKLVN